MPYQDMREFLAELDHRGLLKHILVEVDKDWEISTLARTFYLQRGPEDRPALCFDKVKGFDMPVVVSAFGNRTRYALALKTSLEGIRERWSAALTKPLEPKLVSSGPCKENLMRGDQVDLLKFPIPIWTPGKDVGPYITSAGCVTKDPETGIRNVGTYRLQLKGKDKTGIFYSADQHIGVHYRKHEQMNRPMEIAVVLGSDPYLAMTQVTPIPYGMDELAVAGGLKGAPLKLVKCETVDLEVPATSEIVIEGVVPVEVREAEAPFGETSGFMSPRRQSPIIEVKAITFRNHAIYHSFISQMPPSESTLVKCLGGEGLFYWYLTRNGLRGIKDVYFSEAGSNGKYAVISIKKSSVQEPKQICYLLWALIPNLGKYVVVCDDDINIRNPFEVEWALTYRCDPARDTIVAEGSGAEIDPTRSHTAFSGKMGLDATIKRKEDYQLALPEASYFNRIEARWKEYGLD